MVSAAVAVLLCVHVWHAGQYAAADSYVQAARSYFESWAKSQRAVDPDDWNAARRLLESAQRLEPHNSNVLESLGQLYDWAAYGKPAGHPVVFEYHRQMLAYFRAAVRERPVSGYTWANIAQTKVALNEIDPELAHALEAAALLGPWEPEVQFGVAEAGLAAWPLLPEAARQAVRGTLSRGMLRHAKDIAAIAKRRHRMGIVCGLDTLPADVASSLCRR